MKSNTPTIRLIFALLGTALAATANAQSYPTKPVRMILTYSGGIEAIARLMAARLTESLGQTVLVEGQAGAGGSIGATTVAKAPPDGHTILSTTGSTQVQRGFLIKNVPYDPVKDFTPITLSWETLIVVGASNSAPFSSFREMLAYAKGNPGKISYGTSGLGTSHHLALEQINLLAGIDIVHIPYKGGDQVITDVIAGRIQASSSPLFSLEPSVSAGKAKYLAFLNSKRFEGTPDVPSVREIVPGFEAPPLWSGFFGPPNLPGAIVKRLHSDITRIVDTTEVKARLFSGGLLLVNSTPEELAAAIKRDIQTVAGIVKRAKIQPD
ncbi:MAG: Bug family tripartite tricarboxylate transporter substrate binding protein [Burkholderiales bacterium]